MYHQKCPHLFAAEEETPEMEMNKVCRWNKCFNNCKMEHVSWTRAQCKTKCQCWFLEGEESELQTQDEQNLSSSVCRWNTCFKNCQATYTSWTRAQCKKQCNCWFLEGEEQEEEQILSSSICRWNKCFKNCQATYTSWTRA